VEEGQAEGFIYATLGKATALLARHGKSEWRARAPEFWNSPVSSVVAVRPLHKGLTSNHSQELDLGAPQGSRVISPHICSALRCQGRASTAQLAPPSAPATLNLSSPIAGTACVAWS
jgi:hypothetical protein